MSDDIVGYMDMVGADDVESILAAVRGVDIVGASGGRQRSTNAAKLPVSFVGIPRTTLSTTPQAIQVPIQRAIRPDRLVFDRTAAATLLVHDVKVGTISLNASINPIPGDAFSPDAMGTAIRAVVTATPAVGIQITLSVTTGTPVVGGAFFGPSLPG